jgi:hypothetical protein
MNRNDERGSMYRHIQIELEEMLRKLNEQRYGSSEVIPCETVQARYHLECARDYCRDLADYWYSDRTDEATTIGGKRKHENT